jgi:ATP-binding cassette subfamily B protein
VLGILVGAWSNAALAALLSVYAGLAIAAVNQPVPDFVKLRQVALWMVASQLLRMVLQFVRNFSAEALGQRLERDVRAELYANLIGKSMTFHASHPVGEILARATNDVREINLFCNPGLNLVLGSAMFLVMPVWFGWQIHPLLVIPPVVFIGLYSLSVVDFLRRLQPHSIATRQSFGTLNTRLTEALDGIETVKSATQEAYELERFTASARDYQKAFVGQGRVEAVYFPFLLLMVANAVGLGLVGWLYTLGRVPLGAVVEYIGLLGLFGFPVFIALAAYGQLSLGFASAKRILQMLNQHTELDENVAGYAGEMQGAITFQNVSFGYNPAEPVLKDISFHVAAGQTVAIVGQTGSGKSTLAKLLNRTYATNAGQVLLDGIAVQDWQLTRLRQQISIIEQDIFLFSRSIADNIAFGTPNANQSDIVAAAQAAQAHDFISALPDGYQTVIGTRGVTLSGGQRQRIALARALLTQPKILVLDDSTSAIDSATEDQIQRAIQATLKHQTTLLITHRLSQIRWADQIIVLKNGRVAATGTHEVLLASEPDYRRIFEQYQ